MRRSLVLFALAFPIAFLHAQTPAAAAPQAPSSGLRGPKTTCPPTNTLDQLIVALDDAVSGPANKDRTCFRQVLLPNVRLIPVGPTGPRILTADDWIAAVAQHGDEVVTEHQIKFQSEAFGHIAHLWSTYTTSLAGKPLARGINSIQAVYDGQSWRVIEILWQAEDATDHIPAQYLP